MKRLRRHIGRHTARILPVTSTDTIPEPKRTLNFVVLAQYLYNVVVAVLIGVLFALASQYSDYLNQRGEYADRAREDQRVFFCELIGQLYANPGEQLYGLAEQLNCTQRPRPRPEGTAPRGTAPSSLPRDDFSTGAPSTGAPDTPAAATGAAPGADNPSAPAPSAPPSAPPATQAPSAPATTAAPSDDEMDPGIVEDLVCTLLIDCQ